MLKLTKNTHQITKSIFSSQCYLESLLGFCDLCFSIVDCEKELYFECQICNGFIVCLDCMKQKIKPLISHPSDHHFSPGKSFSNTYWINRNFNITCDLCGEKNFFGKHYQCRQCFYYNVCSKCLSEAQQIHYPSEQHIFVYISNPTKIHSNRYILADRALQVLRHRHADSFDQDEITGWTITEAEIINIDEWNNFYIAGKEAKQILEDNDIDFTPHIIEHEKITLSLVLIGNT